MHAVGSMAGWWFDDRQHRSNKWCDESKGVKATTFESTRTSADPQDAAAVCGCEERAPVAPAAVLLSRRACRQADDWGWGSRPRPRTTSRVVNIILEIGSGLTLTLRTTSSCRASPSTSRSPMVCAPLPAQLACHPTRAHLRACPLQAWSKPSLTFWTRKPPAGRRRGAAARRGPAPGRVGVCREHGGPGEIGRNFEFGVLPGEGCLRLIPVSRLRLCDP